MDTKENKEEEVEVIEKRKKGRPAKENKEVKEIVVKRKRGRPSKVANDNEAKRLCEGCNLQVPTRKFRTAGCAKCYDCNNKRAVKTGYWANYYKKKAKGPDRFDKKIIERLIKLKQIGVPDNKIQKIVGITSVTFNHWIKDKLLVIPELKEDEKEFKIDKELEKKLEEVIKKDDEIHKKKILKNRMKKHAKTMEEELKIEEIKNMKIDAKMNLINMICETL